MKSAFRKWRANLALQKARSEASLQHFHNALSELSKIYSLYGEAGPSLNTPLIVNILSADFLLRSERKWDSFNCCKIALEQISQYRLSNDLYNVDELNHLSYYCKRILAIITDFKDSEAFRIGCSIEVTSNSINSPAIRSFIRRAFNISADSAKEFDRYYKENCD